MCEQQDMNVVTSEVVVAGHKKLQLCKIRW